MSDSAKPRSGSWAVRAYARLNRATAADDPNPDKPPAERPGAPPDQNADPDPRLEEQPSMDPEEGDDPEALDQDDDQFTLEDIIKAFLRANSSPSDEQVHAFAELVGLSYEEFEAEVFKKFGEVVRQAVRMTPSEELDNQEDEDSDGVTDDDLDPDEDDQDEDDDTELDAGELDVQDDIDMFIMSYVLFNPAPTDDQIHQLAFVIDLTKEEMEQRIYRMLGTFLQSGDESLDPEDDAGEDDDTDEDQDDVDGSDDSEDTDQPDSV